MDELLLLVVYSISPVDGSKRLFIKEFVSSKQAAAIVLWNYGIYKYLIEMGVYSTLLYSINLDIKEITAVSIPTIEFKEDC